MCVILDISKLGSSTYKCLYILYVYKLKCERATVRDSLYMNIYSRYTTIETNKQTNRQQQ